MERQVMEIIAKQLRTKPEDIAASSTLIGNLGMDSLDLVEILLALEIKFGLTISEVEADK